MRKNHALPALLILMTGLAGCSASSVLTTVGDFISGRGFTKTDLEQITVLAEAGANKNSATSLDVVFIYEDSIIAMLPKTGPEWFSKRDELQANLSAHMDVSQVEIPPNYLLQTVPLPERYSIAIKVLVYANYLNKKGQKPIDLGSFIHPQLTLKAKSIAFTELKKGG